MFGLGLLKGMGVTIRHFIESYVYDRKPWQNRYDPEWLEKHQRVDHKGLYTIQYPEQRRQVPENYRCIPMLIYDGTPDNLRCTACGICARVCPPQCIWIARAIDDKGRPKARPGSFWIDATVCMSCGSCAEYCPFDAIKMNQQYEIATADRRELLYDIGKLAVPTDYYAKLHPTDYAAEEAARRQKEEARRQAEEAKQAAQPGAKPAEVKAE